MDIKTLLHNLREEVSCSVCSNIFTDPKQLPCLHSFCLNCLRQWHRTSHGRDTIRCPNCQTLSRVPTSGDLKDLPTSFYLNGLIDVLAIKECKTNQVRCGNCDKKSSENSYCFQCCVFWCDECIIGHNIIRGNKDHRVLALKDFQEKDYEDVLKRRALCSKQGHKKEELKYFCKNCETAVCQACVTVDHGGHSMALIEEEAEKQKTQMKALIETQTHNLQEKMNEVRRLDEEFAKVIHQSEEVKKDIQIFVDNLIAVIEAKKQNILAAVEIQTKNSLDGLTKQKAVIEHQIKVIESSLENADKVLTRSTNAEIVQLKKSLQAIFEGLDQTEPTDRDPEGPPIRLVFVNNENMLDTINTAEIGFLRNIHKTEASQCIAEGKGLETGIVGREAPFVLTTRDAEGRQCYNERDNTTVEIKDEQGREYATEVRINSNQDGTYKIEYFPTDPGRCKVTVKVNGERVHGSLFLVLVQPFHVKPFFSFGKRGSSVGMFDCPWGIAVNTRDEIAVTDFNNNRVQIFNIDGNYLRSFSLSGVKVKGIAINKNGNIFVVDNSNCRIQIFSEMGNHLGSFGGKGSTDSKLCNPCGLSVDSDGNIIVADTGNKLIKIFSPDGKFLMKIGEQDSFNYPIHCVQGGRYLMVSDMSDRCIKVFDRNGNFQYKFGKFGNGDGEFHNIGCMSLTKSGHLIVSDTVNHRIQVFTLDGKFVGKFGTKGSNLGEFNQPWSAAVLNNGRIVVSEQRNHRIQIFE